MKDPTQMLEEGGVDASIADVICMRFPQVYSKENWAIIRRMAAFEINNALIYLGYDGIDMGEG